MAENHNPTKTGPHGNTTTGSENAAKVIRDRIHELHEQHQNDIDKRSHNQATLLERFWAEHGNNPNKEIAWNNFYANLSDAEKHQLWQEAQNQPADQDAPKHKPDKVETGRILEEEKRLPKNRAEAKKKLLEKSKQASSFASKHKSHFGPFVTAILVVVFVMLLNYNDLVVAQVKQYVTPGSGQNSPVIIDPNSDVAIGKEPRIIIPKINVDVPVVYDVKTFDEAQIQAGLERGVVHYGNTPVPGQAGNNVIVGHSSNNFFNSGKYKFAFVLLDRLEIGDTFILNYEGKRYIYKVYNKVVVEPTDFSIIQPTATPTTTLITCTPPGTSWRRLAIQGEQISPSPTEAQTSTTPKAITPDEASMVPGNSQSLFDRMWDSVF